MTWFAYWVGGFIAGLVAAGKYERGRVEDAEKSGSTLDIRGQSYYVMKKK